MKAMQYAHLHDSAEVHKVWHACKVPAEGMEVLDLSRQNNLDLLEHRGFSLKTNEHLQKMVAEDYNVPFVEGDPDGNFKRINSQVRKRLEETVKFFSAALAGKSYPIAKVIAAGYGSRGFSTSARDLSNAQGLPDALVQAQLDSLPGSLRAALVREQADSLPDSLLASLPASLRESILETQEQMLRPGDPSEPEGRGSAQAVDALAS